MPIACFLTWIEHRRTRELCRRLDLELVELISVNNGLRRYLELIPRTIRLLLQSRPRLVLVQSPSIVLAALLLLVRPWLRYQLIIDAHNEAVEPYLHSSLLVLAITRWLLKRADLVIVTNEQLARIVARYGGKPIALVDPLPTGLPLLLRRASPAFRVTVISTYAADEPFDAIVAAAADAGSEYQFFVTGNPAKLSESVRRSLPPNVTLTGYLPDAQYWCLLANSEVVLDLTTMDNCLVCGAYEAIAAGVPLVLSDNAPSVATFRDFAEFTENRSRDIVTALERIRARHGELVTGLPQARDQFEKRWAGQARPLLDFIQSGGTTR